MSCTTRSKCSRSTPASDSDGILRSALSASSSSTRRSHATWSESSSLARSHLARDVRVALGRAHDAEAGDGRQQQRVAEAVGEVEVGADRAAHAVDERDARVRERGAGEGGAEHHGLACRLVVGVLDHAAHVRADQPRRLEREHVGEDGGLLGDVGLDRVGERVDADPRGQVRRRAHRQLVVRDGDAGHQVAVEHHHLHVALGVGDDRHARDLAPGAGRRRDRHERQAGARDLVVARVVAHVARVGEGHGGRLGRVHRAAAADRHDAVGLVVAQRLRARP